MRTYVTTLAETIRWNLGGSWITPDGSVYEVDHANDLHHGDIAVEEFGDYCDPGNEEYYGDDYHRDACIEAAFNEGWVREALDGNKLYSITAYATKLTNEQKRIISDNAVNTHYDRYVITDDEKFEEYTDVSDFLKSLKRW
ncbi:MAG: hypothetical protein WC284_13000 [Candidimonas sp.]